MQTGSTTRRWLPEAVLLAVTAAVGAAALLQFGGKEAADTGSVAWSRQQEAACAAAAGDLAAASSTAHEIAAAVAALSSAPDPGAVASWVSGASRMAAGAREATAAFRRVELPADGVNRAAAERVVESGNLLATYWESLGTEYADLETNADASATQRIADWTLRVDGVADQWRAAFTELQLTGCAHLAGLLTPTP
ncbi:MAG: hypothetical protein ACT4QG_16025 [Sporichthyaceae bacterium]